MYRYYYVLVVQQYVFEVSRGKQLGVDTQLVLILLVLLLAG